MSEGRDVKRGTPLDTVLYTAEAAESSERAEEDKKRGDPPRERAVAVLGGLKDEGGEKGGAR